MKPRAVVALVVAGACTGVACAAGLGFLRDAPIRYFTPEDYGLMESNANAVLESQSTTARRSWVNPQTGNSGGAELRGEFTNTDHATCRRLRVWNVVKRGNIRADATHVLCRYPDRGGWLFHPDAVPAGK